MTTQNKFFHKKKKERKKKERKKKKKRQFLQLLTQIPWTCYFDWLNFSFSFSCSFLSCYFFFFGGGSYQYISKETAIYIMKCTESFEMLNLHLYFFKDFFLLEKNGRRTPPLLHTQWVHRMVLQLDVGI